MPAAGSILLGDVAQHLSSVDIACNFCPRIGKASIGTRDADSNAPAPDLRRLPRDLPPGYRSHAACIYRTWQTCSGPRAQRRHDG
jgi:hypothetical protein